MPEDTKNDFEKKAPKLIKLLTKKLYYLKKTEGPVDDILALVKDSETELKQKNIDKAKDKYQEADGKLQQLVRPLANKLLIVEFSYLAFWLLAAYFTYRYPDYWLWKGMIKEEVNAVWYGVLGGITIGIFGIYNHIRLGDFDPRFKLWYICKPIIGGIFGWFIYGLYLLGFIVVQDKKPEDLTNPMFVYIIAFLAGFSERFILRMIDKIMAVITTYNTTETDKEDKPAE